MLLLAESTCLGDGDLSRLFCVEVSPVGILVLAGGYGPYAGYILGLLTVLELLDKVSDIADLLFYCYYGLLEFLSF